MISNFFHHSIILYFSLKASQLTLNLNKNNFHLLLFVQFGTLINKLAPTTYSDYLPQSPQPSHMNEPHPSPHTSQSQEHFVSSPTRPSTKEITKFKSNPANHPLILSHPAPNLFGQSSPNPFQPHKALLTLISANFSYFWDKIVSTYPLIVIVFL